MGYHDPTEQAGYFSLWRKARTRSFIYHSNNSPWRGGQQLVIPSPSPTHATATANREMSIKTAWPGGRHAERSPHQSREMSRRGGQDKLDANLGSKGSLGTCRLSVLIVFVEHALRVGGMGNILPEKGNEALRSSGCDYNVTVHDQNCS